MPAHSLHSGSLHTTTRASGSHTIPAYKAQFPPRQSPTPTAGTRGSIQPSPAASVVRALVHVAQALLPRVDVTVTIHADICDEWEYKGKQCVWFKLSGLHRPRVTSGLTFGPKPGAIDKG